MLFYLLILSVSRQLIRNSRGRRVEYFYLSNSQRIFFHWCNGAKIVASIFLSLMQCLWDLLLNKTYVFKFFSSVGPVSTFLRWEIRLNFFLFWCDSVAVILVLLVVSPEQTVHIFLRFFFTWELHEKMEQEPITFVVRKIFEYLHHIFRIWMLSSIHKMNNHCHYILFEPWYTLLKGKPLHSQKSQECWVFNQSHPK